jgi:alpha-amylase
MDYETFGEHQWPETGIHEFLRWLPAEILKHEHLQFATPSELIKHEPVGEIDVPDFATLSWADVERSTNAWLGNDMQRTTFNAVKRLEPIVKSTKNESLLRTWRSLQTSDHIYYMYTAPGPSGFVHGYFSQQFPAEAFWAFMKIMSNFYEKVAEDLGEDRTSAYLLRVVPPERAFYFHEDGVYINLSAHSLEEFKDTIMLASDKSILFHTACKQFDNWIRFTIGDSKLADTISAINVKTALNLRQELHSAVEQRVSELLAGLDKQRCGCDYQKPPPKNI